MKCGVFIISFFFIAHQSIALADDKQLDDIEKPNITELLNVVGLEVDTVYNAWYKEKYGHLPVEITFAMDENRDVFEWNNVLHVRSGIAELFLKTFGKSIEKLSVSFLFVLEHDLKTFGKLLSDHCSETLIELECKFTKFDAFANVTVPFKKVQSVAISGVKNWTENSLKFPELFPEIRSLNLTNLNVEIFNYQYPHLVELNANVPVSEALSVLVEKNTQIETLRSLSSTPLKFLHMVNEKLPRLTTLEFVMSNDEPSSDPIHFKHVKDVSIRNQNYLRPDKLHFKQLSRLELRTYGYINDEWTDFIGSNEHLETLVIKLGHFNDSTLSALSTKLHNLTSAEIHCSVAIDVENIAKFLESNERLETLTLHPFPGGNVQFLIALTEKLDQQWIVNPLDEHYYAFKLTPLPGALLAPATTGNSTQPDGASTISISMAAMFTIFIAALSAALLTFHD